MFCPDSRVPVRMQVRMQVRIQVRMQVWVWVWVWVWVRRREALPTVVVTKTVTAVAVVGGHRCGPLNEPYGDCGNTGWGRRGGVEWVVRIVI